MANNITKPPNIAEILPLYLNEFMNEIPPIGLVVNLSGFLYKMQEHSYLKLKLAGNNLTKSMTKSLFSKKFCEFVIIKVITYTWIPKLLILFLNQITCKTYYLHIETHRVIIILWRY